MLVKRIYVCHPFSGNETENTKECVKICKKIVDECSNALPIAPQIYLPQFFDESTDRDRAMKCCIELLSMCDYIYVFGIEITAGMKEEIEYANNNDIPIFSFFSCESYEEEK